MMTTTLVADGRPHRSLATIGRTDLPAFLISLLAAMSTFEPGIVLKAGPVLCSVLWFAVRPLTLRADTTVVAALGFSVWSILSIVWSSSTEATVTSALTLSSCIVLFIFARTWIWTSRQLLLVIGGYLIGCLISAALLTGRVLASGGRTSIDAVNINYLAYAFAAGFAMVVVLLQARRAGVRGMVFPLSILVVLSVGIMVSQTRGALLGIAALAGWLILCSVFRRPPLRVLWAVWGLAAVAIVTGVTDKVSLVFESGGRATGDWSGRLVIWPMAREAWLDNPILGVGAGAFQATNSMGIGAHNVILELGAGLGVVGVLLFMLTFTSALRQPRQAATRRTLLLVGAFVAASAPSYLTGQWDLAPVGWFALAVFSRVSLLDQERVETDDSNLRTVSNTGYSSTA